MYLPGLWERKQKIPFKQINKGEPHLSKCIKVWADSISTEKQFCQEWTRILHLECKGAIRNHSEWPLLRNTKYHQFAAYTELKGLPEYSSWNSFLFFLFFLKVGSRNLRGGVDTVFLGPLALSFPTLLCSPHSLSAPEACGPLLHQPALVSLLSQSCQHPSLSSLWLDVLCEAAEMPEGRSGFRGGVFAGWMRSLAWEPAWDPLVSLFLQETGGISQMSEPPETGRSLRSKVTDNSASLANLMCGLCHLQAKLSSLVSAPGSAQVTSLKRGEHPGYPKRCMRERKRFGGRGLWLWKGQWMAKEAFLGLHKPGGDGENQWAVAGDDVLVLC